MICQEIAIWFVIYWHSNLFAADASKLLVKILLRPIFSQCRRELNGVIIRRNGEEAFVEGFVIERRQTDAITWIEAVLLVRLVCPRNDVAGQQQLWHANSSQGTATAIIGKYHATEVVLTLSPFLLLRVGLLLPL